MAWMRYRNKRGRFAKKGRGRKREKASSTGYPTIKRYYKRKKR